MHQAVPTADIARLQDQIDRLEKEVQVLQDVVERVLVATPPLLFTMPDGSKRPFRPNRPASLRALATMIKLEEFSEKRRHLSDNERRALLLNDLAAARREAVEMGIATEDEREAAKGD